MSARLTNRKVAILATDGVEGVELTEPRRALEAEGATVEVIAPKAGTIQLMDHADKAETVPVDRVASEAKPYEYDALLLPGGVINADHLRLDRDAVRFVRAMLEKGLPVGAICHGAWILIETGLVRGRVLTSYPSLSTDLKNAGARWVDEEVVNDNGLVSSRRVSDLPAFIPKIIEEFAEGPHLRQVA